MDPATFEFADTAVGGVARRNNVRRYSDFVAAVRSSKGATDCFATYLLFTEDLRQYTATNPSPTTGKPPSVAGYPGPALATFVPFDFDFEREPARALTDVRSLVHRLHEHDVPPEAARFAFSGNKGFSAELPAGLFGGFEPGVYVHERLGQVARVLATGLTTVDFKIYEKVRLWRILNTRHSKSGLYKVPLTPHELLHLPLGEIRALARAPREIELPDEGEFGSRDSLIQLWRESETRKTTTGVNGTRLRLHTNDEWHLIFSDAYAEKGSDSREHPLLDAQGRHPALVKMASYLYRHVPDPRIARLLAHSVNRTHCDPPLLAEHVDKICDWFLQRELEGGVR